MWVPPEDIDPVVLHAPTRKSVAFFGAVRPSDGCLVTQQAKRFNADTFETFLQGLTRRARKGRKILLVVDNARWHKAQALAPWLRQHSHIVRLDFLPPYSPELNPIERVWKLTRRLCTHNRYFEVLEELVHTVQEQFQLWYHPNETLRRLCAII
jgi:transposase